MICTFLGHRDTPQTIEPFLEKNLSELIEKGVNRFYVGNHGNFDYIAIKVLERLKEHYSHIEYSKVLAYMPQKRGENSNYSNTIYPDGLENVPPRFAIIGRNKWMIEKADYVVCYVENSLGNAYDFMVWATKKKKKVINLNNYLK